MKNNGIRLTDEQRARWLQLIRSENIGAHSFWTLLENYGTAENALNFLQGLAHKGGKKQINIARLSDARRELEEAKSKGIDYICAGEPDFPPLLHEMEGTPPIVAIKGNKNLFRKAAVSIVGSRNASAAGLKLASQFAYTLGQSGFAVVSGFARGIDTAVHKSSLQSGTIAVFAGGASYIYPLENKELYKNILNHNGAIITEMPLNWVPRSVDFPRRNRLIAGLSLGLLVVEAGLRSGSLITARFANSMGRLTFAIPGSPLDMRAAGTNELIKNGANLVTKAEDIIEALMPLHKQTSTEQLAFFEEGASSYVAPYPISVLNQQEKKVEDLTDKKRERILSLLSTTPVDLDTLCMQADVSLPQLYLALLELDLAGKIIRYSGGLVGLKPT